jgi:hypothetical protein
VGRPTGVRHRIALAVELVRRGLGQTLPATPLLDSPGAVRDYLRLGIGLSPHEVFAVLFLDAQHRLLTLEEMFRGTVSQTSVYPREVVKRALELNASALILVHNTLVGIGLRGQVRIAAAGKVVTAFDIARASALGDLAFERRLDALARSARR